MNILLIITADWKNPETGELHRAGTVASIPGWMTRRDKDLGLHGKYRCPAPWEHDLEPGMNAPVTQPPNPADAPATKPSAPKPGVAPSGQPAGE